MNRVSKLVTIIMLSICAFCYQGTLFASVKNIDPCSQLNGNWKGEWNNTANNCRWKISVDAANYKENVQFIIKYTNGGKGCLPEFTTTLSGFCADGQLNLMMHSFARVDETKMTGRVFGDLLTLEDEKKTRYAHAYKQ